MKQNTKFLWMYVGILFSFALILIVFAGLSHNSEDEQKKGLKEDITELSEKNTKLSAKVSELENQITALTDENNTLKVQIGAIPQMTDVEKALFNAEKMYDEGKVEECRQLLIQIDKDSLTQTQLYIYNILTKQSK